MRPRLMMSIMMRLLRKMDRSADCAERCSVSECQYFVTNDQLAGPRTTSYPQYCRSFTLPLCAVVRLTTTATMFRWHPMGALAKVGALKAMFRSQVNNDNSNPGWAEMLSKSNQGCYSWIDPEGQDRRPRKRSQSMKPTKSGIVTIWVWQMAQDRFCR